MLLKIEASLTDVWDWIGKNDKQLIVVFALVGGFYALFEYWSQERTDDKQEVAKYVQLQSSERYSSARSKLELVSNGPGAANLRKETYAPYFEGLLGDEAVVSAVLTELQFFDVLSSCVNTGRCSNELACQYFFSDAEGFLQNFRPMLAKLQTRNTLSNDSTVYLKNFAHQRCHADLVKYCDSPEIHHRSVDCSEAYLKETEPSRHWWSFITHHGG